MRAPVIPGMFEPVIEPMPPFTGRSVVTRETSAAAATSVKTRAATERERLYRAIAAAPDGLTDDEAQRRLGMGGNTQRPRRRELETAGRITADGTRVTRSGRKAVVWRAV